MSRKSNDVFYLLIDVLLVGRAACHRHRTDSGRVSDGNRSAKATAAWFSDLASKLHRGHRRAAAAYMQFPQQMWIDLAASRTRLPALSVD